MSGGVIIVITGLLILFLAVTGRLECFVTAFRCAFMPTQQQTTGAPAKAGGGISLPQLPQLPILRGGTPPFV